MAIKRYTINEHTNISLQAGDKVVDVYPGPEDSGSLWVTIEREVPNTPECHVGVVGTASIENKYGVTVPDVHGVWVETAGKLFFRAFFAKTTEQAAFPERRVVAFKPDAEPDEEKGALSKALGEAEAKAKKADRRAALAEKALRMVADDLHLLRHALSPQDMVMRTSQGATTQRWVVERLGQGA